MLPSRLKTRPNSLLKLTAMSLVVATLSGCGEDAKDCGGFWDKTFGREECAAQAKNQTPPTKSTQSITDLNLSTMKTGEKVTLDAKASSGLTIAYTTKTPNICTVSGAEVTALVQGDCTVEATQAGDDKFLPVTTTVTQQVAPLVCEAPQLINESKTSCYTPEGVKQGAFVDSYVENLGYKGPTYSGVTDQNGKFYYLEGESVEFYVHKQPIASIKGREIVHVYDLNVGWLYNEINYGNRVAALLQSLDVDGNPDNGIKLDKKAENLFVSPKTINFLGTDQEYEQSLKDVLQKGGINNTVSLAQAQFHALQSLAPNIQNVDCVHAPQELVGLGINKDIVLNSVSLNCRSRQLLNAYLSNYRFELESEQTKILDYYNYFDGVDIEKEIKNSVVKPYTDAAFSFAASIEAGIKEKGIETALKIVTSQMKGAVQLSNALVKTSDASEDSKSRADKVTNLSIAIIDAVEKTPSCLDGKLEDCTDAVKNTIKAGVYYSYIGKKELTPEQEKQIDEYVEDMLRHLDTLFSFANIALTAKDQKKALVVKSAGFTKNTLLELKKELGDYSKDTGDSGLVVDTMIVTLDALSGVWQGVEECEGFKIASVKCVQTIYDVGTEKTYKAVRGIYLSGKKKTISNQYYDELLRHLILKNIVSFGAYDEVSINRLAEAWKLNVSASAISTFGPKKASLYAFFVAIDKQIYETGLVTGEKTPLLGVDISSVAKKLEKIRQQLYFDVERVVQIAEQANDFASLKVDQDPTDNNGVAAVSLMIHSVPTRADMGSYLCWADGSSSPFSNGLQGVLAVDANQTLVPNLKFNLNAAGTYLVKCDVYSKSKAGLVLARATIPITYNPNIDQALIAPVDVIYSESAARFTAVGLGKPLVVAWDFGDGTDMVFARPNSFVDHSYKVAGDYHVTLYSISNAKTQAEGLTVRVYDNILPTIKTSNDRPSVGDTISLTLNTVWTDIKEVLWVIGDAITGILKGIGDAFTTVFKAAGNTTVSATAINEYGQTIGRTEMEVNVKPLVCPTGQVVQAGKCIDTTPAVFEDNFNDNINGVTAGNWIASSVGGATIAEVNQRLELTLPANSPTAPNGVFSSAYISTCSLLNDFDIQTDYELLDWPVANGVRLSLSPSGLNSAVERTSFGSNESMSGEFLLTNFQQNLTTVPTTQTKGTLRLVREGNVFTGYYYAGQNLWAVIGSRSITTTAPVGFDISAHNVNSRGGKAVKVAFDNFKVTKGALVGDSCKVTHVAEYPTRWYQSIMPPPKHSNVNLVYTVTETGDTACATYNGIDCLWGSTFSQIDFTKVKLLICGTSHMQIHYTTDGYSDPQHWCSITKQRYVNKQDTVLYALSGRFDVPATSSAGIAFASPSSTKPLQCSFTASGEWNFASGDPSNTTGPQGFLAPIFYPHYTAPNLPVSALIAKSSEGNYVLIGENATLSISPSAVLRFLSNDKPGLYNDNQGALTVNYTCSEIPQPTWTTNPANGHQYAAVDCGTWTQCEAQAVALGAHLVTVNDAAENAWLLSSFDRSVGNYWIGLTDKDQEGVWKWVNGEPTSFTKWYSGEPSNTCVTPSVCVGEDYVALMLPNDNKGGYWWDADFNDPANAGAQIKWAIFEKNDKIGIWEARTSTSTAKYATTYVDSTNGYITYSGVKSGWANFRTRFEPISGDNIHLEVRGKNDPALGGVSDYDFDVGLSNESLTGLYDANGIEKATSVFSYAGRNGMNDVFAYVSDTTTSPLLSLSSSSLKSTSWHNYIFETKNNSIYIYFDGVLKYTQPYTGKFGLMSNILISGKGNVQFDPASVKVSANP